MNMLEIDAKKGKFKAGGNLIDAIADVALAVFEITYEVVSIRANQSYDDALEEILRYIRHAVKSAYEEEQNGTFS